MDLRRAPRVRNPKSLPVLLAARERIIRDGWGRSDHPSRWSLVNAVLAEPVSVERWHALELLRWCVGALNLTAWNDLAIRTGADAVRALDAAIHQLGAEPPRTQYREPHEPRGRGGWFISATSRPK